MPDSDFETGVRGAPGELMQAGLLLETVQQQQRQVEGLIRQLDQWAAGLDEVLRDSVQQALVQELQGAGQAARGATAALAGVRRQASLRVGLWSLCLMVTCSAVPLALAWALMPSPAKVEAARQQVTELQARVARLKAEGGRIDVRRCGPAPRLCVRVERKELAYGQDGDYLVIKGY